MNFKEIILTNSLDELAKLTSEIEEFAESNELTQKVLYAITLSLEELITNTISYGYKDDELHHIRITLKKNNNTVNILISDDAEQFNPILRDDPDTEAELEKRPIGGLGIHLVKKMMDEIEYFYKNGKNLIMLKKYL